MVEDSEPIYEAASITLTTLLTLIGMKYITLQLIPQKSYATRADMYVSRQTKVLECTSTVYL